MQSRWLTGSVVVCSVLGSVFVACGSEPTGSLTAPAVTNEAPDATVAIAPIVPGKRARRANGVPAGVKPFRPRLAPAPALLEEDSTSPDRVDPLDPREGSRFHDEVTPQCHVPKLSYFDGPIVQAPVVIPVFWNSGVNAQVVASMSQFYADVMNSTFWQWLWEYDTLGIAGGTGQVIVPGTALPGVTLVPSVCASPTTKCTITDAQLQAELNKQITAAKLPAPTLDCTGNSQTIYMVSFPPNVTLDGPDGAGTSCVDFCAYHNTGTVTGTTTPLIYGALMDEFATACSTGCGTNATALENTTDTASHELVESVTDPDIGLDTAAGYAKPAAWGDNNNQCGEIGDICDADGAGDTITVSGRTWTVQEMWSNKQNKCTSTGPALACPTGDTCGTVTNGCATPLSCGTCTLPETCGGGTPTNANECGCTPLTACIPGVSCGTVPNGCGGTISCSACAAPQTCGGGTPSVPNVCGCTPKTTCAAGENCGTESDGCGGTITCGACVAPNTCTANVCGCTPTTTTCPAGQNCGTVPDGCGGTVSCGTCVAPQSCGGGILGAVNVCGCTPLLVCPVGDDCGTVADGCGGTLACGTCVSPATCGGGSPSNVNQCGCTPLTTCPAGDVCGTVADGCGGVVACGTCSATQTCSATNQCVTIVVDAGHDASGSHDASSADAAHEAGAKDGAVDAVADARMHDGATDAHVTTDGTTSHDGSVGHDGAITADTGVVDARGASDAVVAHDAQTTTDAKVSARDGGGVGSADATSDALADGGEPVVGAGGGCSCRTTPTRDVPRTSGLLVLVPLALIGRRRQRRKSATP